MIHVEVEDAAWTAALADVEAVVIRAVEAARSSPPLRGRGRGEGGASGTTDDLGPGTTADLTLAPPTLGPSPARGEGSVTILLADDATVEGLNARFRGKPTPTNVLSFPAPATAEPHLGDIVLAYGVCASEAAEQAKPLAHHLMHLTAHGVLHLLGYDHQTDADAEVMEALEREILASLGVPDPYAPTPHETDDPL